MNALVAAQVDHNSSTESQIRRLHVQLITAYMNNDAATLNRILADEYTFIDDAGRFLTKPHIVESFRSRDHRIARYDISEEAIRVYGDAAVLTYRYVSQESYKGQDGSGVFRITRVFARKNGRWVIVAGQETRIAP